MPKCRWPKTGSSSMTIPCHISYYLCSSSAHCTVILGGLVVIVLVIGPNVIKICSTTSFGVDVKPLVPCHPCLKILRMLTIPTDYNKDTSLSKCKDIFRQLFSFSWRWGESSTQAWLPTYVSILRISQMIRVWRVTVEWYTDRGKPKNSEKNLSQCHVHHMDWPRRELGPPRWEASD
jgi:hypothetical protein